MHDALTLDQAIDRHNATERRVGVGGNDTWPWRTPDKRDLRGRLRAALDQLDAVDGHGTDCACEDDCGPDVRPLSALADVQRLEWLLHEVHRLVPRVECWRVMVRAIDREARQPWVFAGHTSEEWARELADALNANVKGTRRESWDVYEVSYGPADLGRIYQPNVPVATLAEQHRRDMRR